MLIETMMCLVVGIADGDTLTARCGTPGAYKQVRVRIEAIDAPEKKQPFGQVSRQSLADLCFKQEARIQPNGQRSYDRIVGGVQCKGKDVAAHQVSKGLAWVEPKYAKHRQDLFPLEKKAKTQKLGFWSLPNPQRPSEFRHSKTKGGLL